MIFETNNTETGIEPQVLRRAALNIRAVNHRLRQRILSLLEDHGFMSVTDMYIRLREEQSVVSQMLSILRRAGVVKTRREGKTIFYSIEREMLDKLYSLARQLGEL